MSLATSFAGDSAIVHARGVHPVHPIGSNKTEVRRPEKLHNMSRLESVGFDQAPRATLDFDSGVCFAAQAPIYPSKVLTGFFTNIIQHYIGKTPTEISRHARQYCEAIKYWPAPSDMRFGWALTQQAVRMDLTSYANQAEAARKSAA